MICYIKIGDYMDSFLKELEKYYSLFDVTNNEIIELFHFPADVYDTFKELLSQSNRAYYKNCTEAGKDYNKLGKISLGKDEDGKCYLKVVGNDNHTILIIRSDDSRYEAYRGLVGHKVVESAFKEELDLVQMRKLEKYQSRIPHRFIKEEIPPLDVCKEMNIPLLINYYQYINEYNRNTVSFKEPKNTNGPAMKHSQTMPRKHPIIPWEDRQKELLKRNPVRVIRYEGEDTGSVFEAYLYERDGNTLAVVEPASGIEYQFNLNLGQVPKDDLALIKEMIQTALEAPEDIVMLDDAIIRKNHTTIDAFSQGLDVFLDNAKDITKFYYDVRKANNVYKR